ncbi:MAG: hypothetical protein OXR73_37705 [Myxococcales bacterium]|nr:hypothetical protein [Myxococcales bacterium]
MKSPATTWLDDLQRLPARCLPELPAPTVFTVYLEDVDEHLSFTTWEIPEPREAPAAGRTWLDRLELAALVAAVEADRFFAEDLRGLCRARRSDPAARLTEETALSGAMGDLPDPSGRFLSLEEVLTRLDASLISVQLRDDDGAAHLENALQRDAEGTQRAAA